ncbi:c-type cytochrome [Paludisphaera mucosa]|uniref:Cytochrome c n=1 Tax=Paludisphaera mucosa TaxID=3030827 RepID=A0ABT6FLE5_9BACT|nr:cytochrome c [Paludisphaera mucosa]MDG3008188.1 cytochrome c [Paludisphaera mucosa]
MRPNTTTARVRNATARRPQRLAAAALAALLAVAPGCTDMYDQPRFEPYEATTLFSDGASSRTLVLGTVPREDVRGLPAVEDRELLLTGLKDGVAAQEPPFAVDRAVLERGKQRYGIYCTPCHGQLGDGRGVIVQRGFTPPPKYTEPRLVDAPLGHFFQVISNGHGAMYSFAARVAPQDRWAIAAYIRALQLSQNAKASELPPEDQSKLQEAVK